MIGSAVRVSGQIVVVVAVFTAWELGARAGLVDVFHFGSPGGILDVLGAWSGEPKLLSDLASTLIVFAAGWILGVVLGVLVGAGLATSRTANEIAAPFLAFLNATPRMVFYPFFGLALGFSTFSKIGLVVFVIVVFVIFDVLTGLQTIDRSLVDNVRVSGGRRADLLRQVYLPSLLGSLITSSRITVAFALQATIISEFFGPAEGLGHRIVAGQGAFQVDEVWAAIFLTLVIAIVLDGALQLVRARATAWSTR